MAEHVSDKSDKSNWPSHLVHDNCHNCSVSCVCLPASLSDEALCRLERLIMRIRPLRKREHLLRAGDPVRYLYALRAGSLKTFLLSADGVEHITGFMLPGDLAGLDALGMGQYPHYCVALEHSTVCVMPLQQLDELAGLIPALRQQLFRSLSRGTHEDHEHQSLSHESAMQRLIAFLLNFSARCCKRGLSATSFRLPMSRSDIANYLGMTTETASRLFTRLRDMKLIVSSGHEIQLLDIQALSTHARLALSPV